MHRLATIIYTSGFIVSCNIKYFNYQYHPMIRYPMIFEYSICLKENYWSYDTLRYDIRSKFLIVDSTLVLTLDTPFLFGRFWKRLHNVLIQNSNSKFLIFIWNKNWHKTTKLICQMLIDLLQSFDHILITIVIIVYLLRNFNKLTFYSCPCLRDHSKSYSNR